MTFHELKDIVMIYSSSPSGLSSYEWNKAKIKVWNPAEQREMNLVFTGSTKEESPEDYKIHFNVNYVDEKESIIDAYKSTLKELFPDISDETLTEYTKVYIQKLLKRK